MRFSIVLSMLAKNISKQQVSKQRIFKQIKKKNPGTDMNDIGSCFNEIVTSAIILHRVV